jgi:hypothetical protein
MGEDASVVTASEATALSSGILVVAGDTLDEAILRHDEGKFLKNWVVSGNQLVCVGGPLQSVRHAAINRDVSAYEFLTQIGVSSGSSTRLVHAKEFSGGSGSSCVTYQGTYNDPLNYSRTMTLGDTLGDYLQFTANQQSQDGSLTFVFGLAVADAAAKSMPHLRFDISVDNVNVLEDVSMDTFRNPETGLGISGQIIRDNTRLYVQHVGDIEQSSSGPIEANYLLYLTTDRLDRFATSHTIRLDDKARNSQDTQQIRLLELSNVIEWDRSHFPERLSNLLNKFVGLPFNGAGLAVVTSKEILVAAKTEHKECLPLYSSIGFPICNAKYAIDLSAASVVHVYSRDGSGNYGEATFRVGSGLVTLLSPCTDEDIYQVVEKLTYVLTGRTADFRNLFCGGLSGADGFGLNILGNDFHGLTAYWAEYDKQESFLSDVGQTREFLE